MVPIVFLVGPTGVGKSKIAIKLAKFIDGEIVSCDSMQVYKGIDIATSKPSFEEREIIPHHMLDILEPCKEYSVAEYRRDALKVIEELISRGKIPLIVGGSGLYFKALLDGIFNGPGKDEALRKTLYQEAKEKGSRFLYERLKSIDPKTAEKIHFHDLRRIIRALEVYYISGIPLSLWQKKSEGIFSKYRTIIFGILRPRKELYRLIDERVEEMFNKGIVEEIKGLREKNITPIAQQFLGYGEVSLYLEGKISLQEAKELLKKNTRRFAKRQLTWFRKDKRITWIQINADTDLDSLVKQLVEEIWKTHCW